MRTYYDASHTFGDLLNAGCKSPGFCKLSIAVDQIDHRQVLDKVFSDIKRALPGFQKDDLASRSPIVA